MSYFDVIFSNWTKINLKFIEKLLVTYSKNHDLRMEILHDEINLIAQ